MNFGNFFLFLPFYCSSVIPLPLFSMFLENFEVKVVIDFSRLRYFGLMTDCTDKQTCVILESISRVKCDKITQLTLMMIQQRELLGKYQCRLRLLQ